MDESQLRLAASVFSNAHDGIMITDAAGVVLDVNRAFTQITGYAPDEIIGQQPDVLKSDVHAPEFYREMWRNLATDGFWRGEIWNRRKSGEIFVELLSISAVRDGYGKLTHYVAIYTDITALKESQQRLEHLAYFDALTHLPNRVLLADRIQQALAHVQRRNALLAVCFLDLDNFKPINDRYGHETGDRLLIGVAQRLKESLRAGDTVARLGGDEFALLLIDLENPEEAAEILDRLLATVAAPYPLDGIVATISASIGYTLVPQDSSDSDNLLRHADQAMYAAKLNGRNRCHLFDTEHDQRMRSEHQTMSRVQQALAAGELRLHYQPKVNMRSGTVVGVEALIRWQHPEFGLLVPSEFLLALGDHALLVDIGDWVIQQAVEQLAAWRAIGLELPISVNISGSHLLHQEFFSRLSSHLAANPAVAPHLLELEILETAALEDFGHVSRVIEQCRSLGVDFSLDDFGTGYSSLVYLKRLQVNTLKIDQSFVQDMLNDPDDLAIVEGILGLTSAFKRRVVAEGVETIEHGILLLHLNCDVGQGFAISPPMQAAVLPQWVANFKAAPAWQDSLAHPWQRNDFPLLAAEAEQRRWIETVIRAVENGDKDLPPNMIGNLRQSRFGQWLYGHASSRYGHLPLLSRVEEKHLKAHRIGTEITVRLARGDRLRAIELATSLRDRGEELLATLRELRGAIVAESGT